FNVHLNMTLDMKPHIVVLGAGFGGLELTSVLSERIGDRAEITLIDKNDTFYFGFSKFDVMFGKKTDDAVKIPYSAIAKPGVRFRREEITAFDPASKRVTTDKGSYQADVLVIALGADYDMDATPGLIDGGNEFYTFAGANKLREIIPTFKKGHALVGVCGAPFKCPPAPSECALLMHDHLTSTGVRYECEITIVMPFPSPIPPSPDSSKALLEAFVERNIKFIPKKKVGFIDKPRKTAVLDDGSEIPFDLFLGIPKHVPPKVVIESGMVENGWVPVDRKDLSTKYRGVYAVGDVTAVGTPKAGVFAEGAAKVAADAIIAELEHGENPGPYNGAGSCYIEYGEGKVGRVDVDFFSGPAPKGIHHDPSELMMIEKEHFGSSRKSRWFGL
ncbi:MAG TPA: FAD-dependent oxidoreductase, partial [Puia sp.]|nr:FAD-dependent oxidoreductase [Puia sp.]